MHKIGAGIVLFNPDIIRLKLNIDSIYKQVDMIIIVDNASDNYTEIKKIITEYPNIILYRNLKNLGIATALNKIFTISQQYKIDWLLTLDQDSVCSHDIIKNMSKFLQEKLIGILYPLVNYEGMHSKLNFSENTKYITACMTSGSLIKVKAWKEIGGFRDDFFIDFVDNDFCMKLSIHGFKILQVNNCKIDHQLGKIKIRKIFFMRIKYVSHEPWRYYYIVRNNIIYIIDYRKYLYIFKESCKLGYIIAKDFILSNEKKKLFYYIKLGIIDSIKYYSSI